MASARTEDEDGITSINITPLVDVFLVLLILEMISSSLPDHREIPVKVTATLRDETSKDPEPPPVREGRKAPARFPRPFEFGLE